MLGGLLFSVIDTTIVSTALITIATDLHNFQDIYWVVLAYLLSYLGKHALIFWSHFWKKRGQELSTFQAAQSDSPNSPTILAVFRSFYLPGSYSPAVPSDVVSLRTCRNCNSSPPSGLKGVEWDFRLTRPSLQRNLPSSTGGWWLRPLQSLSNISGRDRSSWQECFDWHAHRNHTCHFIRSRSSSRRCHLWKQLAMDILHEVRLREKRSRQLPADIHLILAFPPALFACLVSPSFGLKTLVDLYIPGASSGELTSLAIFSFSQRVS